MKRILTILLTFMIALCAVSATAEIDEDYIEFAECYSGIAVYEELVREDLNKAVDKKLELFAAQQRVKHLAEELEKEYDADKEAELRKLESQIETLENEVKEIEAIVTRDKEELGRLVRRMYILLNKYKENPPTNIENKVKTLSNSNKCDHNVYVMLDRGNGCYDFVPFRYITEDDIWAMGTENWKARERYVQGTCLECNQACTIVYDWWYNFLRIE